MDTLKLVLLLAWILATGSVYGVTTTYTYYGVNLNAALTTQLVSTSTSGTTYSVHTTPVTSQSIINGIYNSGTTSAHQASDLAMVLAASSGDIIIINTSGTDSTITTIGTTGSNNSGNEIAIGTVKTGSTNSVISVSQTISDFEFTIPGVSPAQPTIARVSGKLHAPSNTISGLLISFSGGVGYLTAGGTYFQGTVKQNTKVYHLVQ